jgi:hypothetical protein
MALERCRDVAHVSAVQLRTQVPEQTIDSFHTHGTPPVVDSPVVDSPVVDSPVVDSGAEVPR